MKLRLLEDQVLAWHSEAGNRLTRVVSVDVANGIVHLYDMEEGKKSFPWPARIDDLQAAHDALSLTVIADPYGPLRQQARDAATPAQQERRALRWSQIGPIVRDPGMLDSRSRGEAVAEALSEGAKLLKDPHAVYEACRRCWCRGMVPDSLLPNFHSCGSPGKERSSESSESSEDVGAKRGVKRKKEGKELGIPIGPAELLSIRTAIETHYFGEKLPLTDAYDLMIEKDYSITVLEDGMEKRRPYPTGAYPTYHQFKYWFHKLYSADERLRGRRGHRDYVLNERPLVGKAKAFCVGAIFEVDGTELPINVVDDETRLPAGRPQLYGILDRFSTYVVAAHVFLGHEGWEEVIEALTIMVEEKVGYCARFGLAITSDQWPAHGVIPESIYADNGPLKAIKAEPLFDEALQIKVDTLESGRGDRKPYIERLFRSIKEGLIASLPGYTDRSYGDAPKALKDAAMTVSEVQREVNDWVIWHNNENLVSSDLLDPEVLEEIETPTPLAVWNWGMEHGDSLRPAPSNFRTLLLPQEEVTIRPRLGLTFRKLRYTSPTVLALSLGNVPKQERKRRIAYDPGRVDVIYLIQPDGSREECHLIGDEFAGPEWSWKKYENYRKAEKQKRQEAEEASIAGRAEYLKRRQERVAAAKAQTKDLRRGLRPGEITGGVEERKEAQRDREIQRRNGVRSPQPNSTQSGKVVPLRQSKPTRYDSLYDDPEKG